MNGYASSLKCVFPRKSGIILCQAGKLYPGEVEVEVAVKDKDRQPQQKGGHLILDMDD